MEMRLYLQMLKRGWWIILLTALVALAAALGVSYLAVPKYEVVARFIVSPGSILITGDQLVAGLNTLDRQSIMTTYTEVMSSDRIFGDALSELQLLPDDIKDYSYEATVLSNSSVLELRVKGPDPKLAADLANAIGNQTIDFTRRLYSVYSVDFLDIAVPTLEPVSPQPLLNASLAMILGLVGGSIIAILNEQLRIPFETFLQRFQLDSTTGVYNSTYFHRLVEDEIAQNPENVFTLGIIELNGLRDLLETVPKAGLESILQRATYILRRELRGHDIIGRWDSMSFAVMLPGTPGKAASGIFGRVFQALSVPVELSQFSAIVNLDAHIGGVEYANDITVQELFEKAVSTLEQARLDNNNPVYVWEMKNPFWTS